MNLHQPSGSAPAGDPVNFPSTCSSTLTDPSLRIQLGSLPKFWAPTSVCLGGALETRQIGLNVVWLRENKKPFFFFSGVNEFVFAFFFLCSQNVDHASPTSSTRRPGCVYLNRRPWPGDRPKAHTFVHLCPRGWITHARTHARTGALIQNTSVWKLSWQNVVTGYCKISCPQTCHNRARAQNLTPWYGNRRTERRWMNTNSLRVRNENNAAFNDLLFF